MAQAQREGHDSVVNHQKGSFGAARVLIHFLGESVHMADLSSQSPNDPISFHKTIATHTGTRASTYALQAPSQHAGRGAADRAFTATFLD